MDWQEILVRNGRPWKIMFVCSGNIMRSPYAEFQAKRYLQHDAPDLTSQILFQSGAVIADNQYIHPLIKEKLLGEGFSPEEINHHIPRYWNRYPDWFKQATLFIAMATDHKKILDKRFSNKTLLLSEAAGKPAHSIEDPYYNRENIDAILLEIRSLTEPFVKNVIQVYKESNE